MAENHGEVKVLNSPSESSTLKVSGLLVWYATTPFGSELRCGTSEPGTAPIASSRRRTRAVRMLVSCRQKKRR